MLEACTEAKAKQLILVIILLYDRLAEVDIDKPDRATPGKANTHTHTRIGIINRPRTRIKRLIVVAAWNTVK